MKSIREYLEVVSSQDDVENYHHSAYEIFSKENEKRNFVVSFAEHNHEDLHASHLKGLVVSVKDCFTTKDLRTTAGSKILENYVPVFDATIVKRIKNAGGFIIAKTAMDEFGFGSFSTNYFQGPVKNALDDEYVAGGSSGGSGVATAIAIKNGIPHVSIAESTGGSISNPAAFNGVFSLTPTYGLLSRYGLIDYASSLDKPGIMASCIEDIAFVLDVIAGRDINDSTTIDKPIDSYVESLKSENPLTYRVAYIENYVSLADKDIQSQFYGFLDFLNEKGFSIEPVKIPYVDEALAAYYIIATSEASTNLAKYCGMRYGQEEDVEGKIYDEYFSTIRSKYFGKEAKRRVLLGTFARMSGYRDAYYIKATKIRTLVIEAFKQLFSSYDVLLAPTMPIYPIKLKDVGKLKPHEIYALDVLTVGVNLASVPHINVPIASGGKFPWGLHVIGNHLEEHKILAFSNFIEQTYKKVFRW